MNNQSETRSTLLIELGCEELPAGPLPKMAEALTAAVSNCLVDAGLLDNDASGTTSFTPRRLAVQFPDVLNRQADQSIEKRGPAVNVAFDSDGNPTPAALGFARSVQADVNELQRLKTDQGEWLQHTVVQPGQSLAEVLQQQLPVIINKIPMPKTMRWGSGSQRFLRPVHWLVAMHGQSTLPLTVFDLQAGNLTYGHRVHSSEAISLDNADEYRHRLQQAYVIADGTARQQKISQQMADLAADSGLQCPEQPGLCEEVANLVEWPSGMLCSFDPAFLDVPAEALTLSMKTHQKFFPLYELSGENRLNHHFIAFANLESTSPEQVKVGFERVIRPRLADAKFFWDQDRKQPLASYAERLANVTFQQDLGSLADKTRRTALLATEIANKLNTDTTTVNRAAELSLCDLMTEMVGEFPELQGIMGRYYALQSEEHPSVAAAIEEHYHPVAAGKPIAASLTGQILAVAERSDRLLGIFAAGKKPTGNKDPFALRRAALGLIRTILEGELELPLDWLLQTSGEILSPQIPVSAETTDEVIQFIFDRLEGYLPVSIQTYRAVAAKQINNLLDFSARASAVESFSKLPQAASLAAANKRASNLLRKNPLPENTVVSEELLHIDAEEALFAEINNISSSVDNAMQQRDYASALTQLAHLQVPVDQFFEDVMVMVDEIGLRYNRLALLASLQSLCSQVADIAELDV